MHTTSVDGDRIFTKNNTLPISERVEGESVTRGWGFTRGGRGCGWVGGTETVGGKGGCEVKKRKV